MEFVGLLVAVIGLVLFVGIIAVPVRKKYKSPGPDGIVVEGKIVHLKEWFHEGHRRCQAEYAYDVLDPETGEPRTLRGKSNCIPKIFDRLELNVPVKVRYLPQKPEFSRPLFDD